MKKVIIAVVAFIALFSLGITGAMAQTWTWNNPALYNGSNPLVELATDSVTGDLYAIDNTGAIVIPTLDPPLPDSDVAVAAGGVPPFAIVDMAGVPAGIFYVIGATVVGTWDPATNVYDTTMTQPFIPSADPGVFASLAVGRDGILYILYNGAAGQYILAGTPPVIPEPASIKFLPRTLNLGSKGNWVSVHIQLPSHLDESLIDVNSVRISEIAVDGFPPKAVEIYPAPGAPWNVGINDLGAQVLKVKFIRYNKKGGADLDEQSLIYQLRSIMSGAQKGKYPVTLTIDGLLTTGELFTGTATFNANISKKLP